MRNASDTEIVNLVPNITKCVYIPTPTPLPDQTQLPTTSIYPPMTPNPTWYVQTPYTTPDNYSEFMLTHGVGTGCEIVAKRDFEGRQSMMSSGDRFSLFADIFVQDMREEGAECFTVKLSKDFQGLDSGMYKFVSKNVSNNFEMEYERVSDEVGRSEMEFVVNPFAGSL